MRAASFLLGVATLAATAQAQAYCRTSHCPATDSDSHVCTPEDATDCGFVVYWPKPRVTYSVQIDASQQVPLDTVRSTVRAAFAAWLAVDCGGGAHPRFEVVETDPVACAKHEYNKERGNANVVLFHDDVWPYGEHDGRLALTTVSYNTETGEIYDADMEINSAHAMFTTSDTVVKTDLLSVVTHEAGHFLGLAHSPLGTATMFATYDNGQTAQRDLSDDDREAICATHPPGEITAECDSTPRHGFSPDCASQQATAPEEPVEEETCCCADGMACETGVCVPSEGCCTIAPGSASRSGPAALVAMALGMMLFGARRRARR
jgi:predicted Zn-dependent protease